LFPTQSEGKKKLEKRNQETIFFNTAQDAKKPHPVGPENTAIPQFEIRIPEISQEKWSNTAIPQTPISPSTRKCRISYFVQITEYVPRSPIYIAPGVTYSSSG